MGIWAKHVEGAIQIAKARGREQLRTRRGLLLFITVRTQMVRSVPRTHVQILGGVCTCMYVHVNALRR